jgi:L-2,4-diaminobutyrate decarboxylase
MIESNKELKKQINEYFINKKNREKCLKLLNKVCKIGIDFKLSKNIKRPVIDVKDQKEIIKELIEPIPEKPMKIDNVIREFEHKIMANSINFSSPNFIAFPDSGNSVASILGHVLSGMLNQNIINSMRTAPTATFVEIAVVNWLRSLIGYKIVKKPRDIFDVGGFSVTGGVMANTIATYLAIANFFPNAKEKGITTIPKKIKIFVPRGISHYSSKACLGWLGIGQENAIEVETTEDFTIDRDDLIKKIELHKTENTPLLLVAYAGDSRTMAIDNFKELYKITKENNMWFHIDACHGASLCFCDKLKKKVEGIELSDSVTLDPHKVLWTPYSLSYILVREPRVFERVAGVSDLITKENFSFGQITPFLGSKPFNSLKLWFLIKNLGRKKIGRFIELRHELAKYFADLVGKERDFRMFNKVTINSAVFIYVPPFLKDRLEKDSEKHPVIDLINRTNLNIQRRLFNEGYFYIHTFQLPDFANVMKCNDTSVNWQVLRLMIGNPLTSKETLKKLILYLRKISKQEAEKIKKR